MVQIGKAKNNPNLNLAFSPDLEIALNVSEMWYSAWQAWETPVESTFKGGEEPFSASESSSSPCNVLSYGQGIRKERKNPVLIFFTAFSCDKLTH